MYKKIMVTLDGSTFSECSLEHLKAIAKGCQVPDTVLMTVVEPIRPSAYAAYEIIDVDWPAKVEKDYHAQAEVHLSRLAGELKKDGLSVQTVIVHGRPAEEILNFAQNNKIDLIIIATHGRSGVSRWAFGSVADRVVRHSPIPVLIVAPSGCRQ